MAVEAFLINPPRRISKKKRNPLAEEALVLGGLNPKRKRSGYPKNKHKKGVVISMAKKRGRPKKRNPGTALALNRKRSLARRNDPGSRLAKRNAPKRRRYHRNEPSSKRGRRRYRRNPTMFGGGGAISLRRPQSLIMPIFTGVIAKMAVDRLPAMMKLQPGNTTIMAQLAIGIGGGIMLTPVLGPTGATIWLAVAGATAVTNWINATMLKGLSDDEEIVYLPNEELNAYPDLEGLSAYPEEV